MRDLRLILLVVATLSLGACLSTGPTPVANPPGQPLLECVGVPADVCQGAVRDAGLNAPRGAVAVRIQVRCTARVCLPTSGQTEVIVQYSDGSTSTFGSGWQEAVPGNEVPPVLPIAPVCAGVPLARCREMALTAAPIGVDRPPIVSIVVTCTKPPCTEATGDGDVVVTFADRSTNEGSWSYRN